MNKLKHNAFWVVCAALGAILAGFIVIQMLPAWTLLGTARNEVRNTQTKLNSVRNRDGGVPSRADIDEWATHKKTMDDDLKAITDSYRTKAENLERWFKDVQDRLPVPPRSSFPSAYRDEREKLEKKLKDAGIVIGIPGKEETPEGQFQMLLGFNWADPSQADAADREKLNKLSATEQDEFYLRLQKRFNIAGLLADACAPTENGKPARLVERLLDIYFFDPLIGTPDRNRAELPIPYVDGLDRSKSDRYAEWRLPRELGTTITFGVAVELPFENVPRFIQHVLNADSILVNIVGCRIFVVKQNEIRMKGTIKVPTGADPMVEKIRVKQDEEKGVNPVNATLLLTCQALDLNRKLLQPAVESK